MEIFLDEIKRKPFDEVKTLFKIFHQGVLEQ